MQRLGHYMALALMAGHLMLAICNNLAGVGLHTHMGDAHPIIRLFGQFTGAHCGYGFFAPQVASPCYVEVGFRDPGQADGLEVHSPRLRGNEARLRYHSFATVFLDLARRAPSQFGPEDPVFAKRLAKAFARSIAEREAKRHNKPLVFCRVYVYRHPSLRTYAQRPLGTKHILYEHRYSSL